MSGTVTDYFMLNEKIRFIKNLKNAHNYNLNITCYLQVVTSLLNVKEYKFIKCKGIQN